MKDKNYIILHDNGGVYEDNTKISANTLIRDYIEGLNEKEDKGTIECLQRHWKVIIRTLQYRSLQACGKWK